MSVSEIIAELEKLSAEERKEVFANLISKMMTEQNSNSAQWYGKKLFFEQACDVVFRENNELFALLAK